MPQPREAETLSELERRKLESELAAARDRQETKTGTLPNDKKKPAAKGNAAKGYKGKKPADTAAEPDTAAATGTAQRP